MDAPRAATISSSFLKHNPPRSDRKPWAIEDVIEWNFGIFGTGFAAGDHALRFLKALRRR